MAVPTSEDPFPLREVPPPSPNDPSIDSIGVRSGHFLNIESIQVKRISGAEEAYIYGTVKVDTCFAIGFAFNRESSQPEMRRVGDFLTITGPNAKLMGRGITKITLEIYDANLSMLDRSISAHIKIAIIGDDGREDEDLEVFGTIALDQVVRVTGTTFQLKLFDHPTVADSVKVTAGGILPLERHIVATPTAVPHNSLVDGVINNPKLAAAPLNYWNSDLPQLVFYVDLWAKGCCDDQVFPIASGISQFIVKPSDKVRVPKEEIIFGNCGRNVLVSFTCFG